MRRSFKTYTRRVERVRWRALLVELMEDYSTETSRAIQTAEVDEETIARLQSLGYAVASTASKRPSEYTPEDDPKNLLHLADKLDLELRLIRPAIMKKP